MVTDRVSCLSPAVFLSLKTGLVVSAASSQEMGILLEDATLQGYLVTAIVDSAVSPTIHEEGLLLVRPARRG